MTKKLVAYRTGAVKQRIVAGRQRRTWMNDTDARYAYRCLPLTIANAMGWEILLPGKVVATWTGGKKLSDITVESDEYESEKLATSHFGHGILTFPVCYLFRTDPGFALWARGIPNNPKDGIAPLDGIIETDWAPFTFTMNWKFTRPGRVVFEKEEPFCFITPIEYSALSEVIPQILPIEEAPEIAAQYRVYSAARKTFNDGLSLNDPATVKQGWQKWYMRGETLVGGPANPLHLSKLNLAEPIELSMASADVCKQDDAS